MRRRYEVHSLVLVIMMCLSVASIPAELAIKWESNNSGKKQDCTTSLSTRTPHSPIRIVSDQNFTDTALAEDWPGDGSSQNPFIIDSLEIDRGGVSGNCISVYNTRVNFTIRNCLLTGATIDPNAGIFLSNVSHALITNSNCSANRFGIRLASGSNYNSIINNTCNYGNRGIRVTLSHHNTIEGNICDGNGDGVYLEGAEWCQVRNNWINDSAWNGIHVEGTLFASILNNTCLFSDDAGIRYFASGEGLVANNTCMNNTFFGIEISGPSSNSLITNNTFVNNDYGIYIADLSECDSLWNILENNRVENAYDGSSWMGEMMYNYWSDYAGTDANNDGIGDTPHALFDAFDPYPLMFNPTPPRWISVPQDVEIEQSDELFHVVYSAYAPAPLYWWVSDGVHFTIDDAGHLVSRYFLEPITYDLKIVVSNFYGISIVAEFSVKVTEDISPSWMIAPHTQTLESHEAFDYYVAAIDPSGIGGWELNNTIQFVLTEYYFEGGSTARLTNASVLSPGIYALNISVFDTHDNKLSSVFKVNVRRPPVDTTSPSWVIASLSETLEFGESFSKQMSAWDASNIDHYWISDTVNFEIDESGLITNATILEVGEYSLEVRAYDPFDNYCSATLIITVVPSRITPPPLDAFAAVTLAAGVGIGVFAMATIVFFQKWRSNVEKA
ncbi:MAG: right-handed parallel beta-helix repeat-containing protein [Candidatus Thorarchaeota archaeon]